VTIPNRLIFDIGYITCIVFPSNPLPSPLKAIARGYIVLFCVSLWSASTVFPHLNILDSPSPSYQYPLHTVPILHYCLSLLISKSMFKGVSWCIPAVSILYFCPFIPVHSSILPLPSRLPFSAAFNTYPYILYLHRCFVLWYWFFSPFIILHLLTCVYIVCATSPTHLHTLPTTPPPRSTASSQNLFHPFLWFCWRENLRDNKKDIAFLLVLDKGN
jgi:hypothetical protein